jgi:hypothetical protein
MESPYIAASNVAPLRALQLSAPARSTKTPSASLPSTSLFLAAISLTLDFTHEMGLCKESAELICKIFYFSRVRLLLDGLVIGNQISVLSKPQSLNHAQCSLTGGGNKDSHHWPFESVAITDTDTKERGALLHVWPSILLLICNFHLRQCWTNHRKTAMRCTSSDFWKESVRNTLYRLETESVFYDHI